MLPAISFPASSLLFPAVLSLFPCPNVAGICGNSSKSLPGNTRRYRAGQWSVCGWCSGSALRGLVMEKRPLHCGPYYGMLHNCKRTPKLHEVTGILNMCLLSWHTFCPAHSRTRELLLKAIFNSNFPLTHLVSWVCPIIFPTAKVYDVFFFLCQTGCPHCKNAIPHFTTAAEVFKEDRKVTCY